MAPAQTALAQRMFAFPSATTTTPPAGTLTAPASAALWPNLWVCLDSDTPCADLQDCNISANRNFGFVCAVGTCCGRNVCISTDGRDGGVAARGGTVGGGAIGLNDRGQRYGGDRVGGTLGG